jgi:hypothetical protein
MTFKWSVLLDGKFYKKDGRKVVFDGISNEKTALKNAEWIIHCHGKAGTVSVIPYKNENENKCMFCGQLKD